MHTLLLLVGGLSIAVWHAPKDPSHQFDFWVGTWNCEGEMHPPSGKVLKTVAKNVITKEFGGHVIHEHFSMKGLNGGSLSVYNSRDKQWHQTWVDDSGSYLAFVGGYADGKMTLSMQRGPDGSTKRMVFSNIASSSFDWDWQRSMDDGKTWTTAWHLHYTRVK